MPGSDVEKAVSNSQYINLYNAYRALVSMEFKGRHTKEGQKMLAFIRNWIAKESGLDPETIQDMAEQGL